MEIVNYKPVGKGSLVGMFDVFLPKLNWTITGWCHFENDQKRWVSPPQRPFKKDDKTLYYDLIKMDKQERMDICNKVNSILGDFLKSQASQFEEKNTPDVAYNMCW